MWNIFENGWLLLTTAGILLVAASIYRQIKPEHGRKPLLIPLVIALLAFAFDAAVQTDYESIEHILNTCKKAAVQCDHKTIMRFISPNYSDRSHKNKSQLEGMMEYLLKAAQVTKARTQSHIITINETSANSDVQVVVHMNANNQYGVGFAYVGLKFYYEKIGREWLIKSAEITSINNQPGDWGNIR